MSPSDPPSAPSPLPVAAPPSNPLEAGLKGLRQILPLAFLAGSVLPFVTVEGCSKGPPTDYRLIELALKPEGSLFIFPMAFAFYLLWHARRPTPSSRDRQIFSVGWVAGLSGLSALVVGPFTFFAFLFQKVTPRIGFWLELGTWILMYLAMGAILVRVLRHSAPDLSMGGDRPWTPPRAWHLFLGPALLVCPPILALVEDGLSQQNAATAAILLLTALPMLPAELAAQRAASTGERWPILAAIGQSLVLGLAMIGTSVSAIDGEEWTWLAFWAPMAGICVLALLGSIGTLVRHRRG